MTSSSKSPSPVGRGTGLRSSGRFEAVRIDIDLTQIDPDDDDAVQRLQRPRTQYFEDESRTVVSENHSPDVPFRYSLNPYRGCLHGCSYCYARPYHEYLGAGPGLDFETRIFVKRSAPELFRRWLRRPGYRPEPVMMSGITDCYQPAERVLGITRGCLQTALDAGQPMSLITKNGLIRRDVDLLAELAHRRLVHVAVSLTGLDQSLTRVLEPATSSPAARLRTIRTLSEHGIPVHVMAAPVIPGLNDSAIPAILNAAADAGASSAGWILLRLPSSVAPIFEDWLQRHRPHASRKVLSRLKQMRQGKLSDSRFGQRMTGSGELAEQIGTLFRVACRRAGLAPSAPPLATDQFRPPGGQLRLF